LLTTETQIEYTLIGNVERDNTYLFIDEKSMRTFQNLDFYICHLERNTNS